MKVNVGLLKEEEYEHSQCQTPHRTLAGHHQPYVAFNIPHMAPTWKQ